MTRSINQISSEEIAEIKYINKQGPYKFNRVNLICNLYGIDKQTLQEILETVN